MSHPTRFVVRSPAALSAFAVLLAGASAVQASAEDTPSEAPSPLAPVFLCLDIVEPAAKLDCFEREVSSLKSRESAREVVAIDADTARELKRDSFGFSLPSLPKLKLPKLGGDGEDGPEEVRLAVKDVAKRGRDWVVELENGQVWVQTSGRLNYVPSGDLEAIISEASLGSYRLKLTNGKTTVKGLKVRRVK